MLTALIDCNNFYVSCERLFKPILWNKPVVILARENGCIVSCSNAVKRLDIKIGTQYIKEKPKLDAIGTVAIVGNLKKYQEISRRVMHSIELMNSNLKIYSIDEAFITLKNSESARRDCILIAKNIEKWTGIPVAIGASFSMTLAKLASRDAKQNKRPCIATTTDEVIQMLLKTKVENIWGIGSKTSKKLKAIGTCNALEYVNLNDNYLRNFFGIEAVRTKYELLGTPSINLNNCKTKQTISSSRVFSKPCNESNVIRSELARHISKICQKAQQQNSKIETITIKLYKEDGKELFTVTQIANNNISSWLNLIDKRLVSQSTYYRAKAVATKLQTNKQRQLNAENNELNQLLNTARTKFGKKALCLGTELLMPIITKSLDLPEVS